MMGLLALLIAVTPYSEDVLTFPIIWLAMTESFAQRMDVSADLGA
jgi:hypothetical protein